MTPTEIRTHSDAFFRQIKAAVEPGAPFTDLLVSAIVHQTQAQWEIAAQIAELNERLAAGQPAPGREP